MRSEKSILAQLSGLKLSDGRSAADLVKFQLTPPSAVPRSGADATFSSAPPPAQAVRGDPATGTTITDISKLLSSGAVRIGSTSSPVTAKGGHSSGNDSGDGSGANKAKAAGPAATEGKSLTVPKPRSELQSTPSPSASSSGKQKGNAKAAPRAKQSQPATAPIEIPAPASSSAHAASAPAASVGSSATPSAPPATAAAVANGGLNPKVVELFNKHSNLMSSNAGGGGSSAPPAAALASAAPSTNTTAAPSAAAAGSAASASNSNSKGSGAPSAEARRSALQAIQFLRDALGVIDNGEAKGPVIRSLPPVPAGGRYIVVGDVHGCVDQFEALIEKVRYAKGKDCLVIIGDYVNKGPDSIGVVQACIKHQALGVLGNHDFTLLKCIDKHRRKPFQPEDMRDPVKQLAKVFPLDCEYYLRGLPHILRLPEYNVLLVHAGLNIQHATLEQQNVYELMHMRRLEKIVTADPAHHKREVTKYQVVVKGSAGVPWGELWEGPEQVIFGHDAYSGFQVHPKATGIDTGCVYGHPLTAVIFSHDSPQGEFINVPGLPRCTNELKGLPPPDAAIYDQQQLELERQIIRPTPRNAASPLSQPPVFLTTPVSQAASPPATRSLTATVTSTNARLTPASTAAMAFPTSRVMTPTSAVMGAAVAQEVADVSAHEVQKATLLAVSAAHELSALAVIMAMPIYEDSLETMLRADADDAVAIGSFWTPFLRSILTAAHQQVSGAAPSANASSSALSERDGIGGVEDLLLYALGVCDDLEEVRKAVQPQLKALQDASVSSKMAKATRKYVELLIR